jgi:predicted nucleic acid-binding protein
MNSRVCVDSNVVLKLAVDEEDSAAAEELWKEWRSSGTERVAPSLIWYELASTLRNRVHRASLTIDDSRVALEKLLDLSITSFGNADLHRSAMTIAHELNRPNAYDSHYLALARELGCNFWTADERLYNAAKAGFPEVRWLRQRLTS